MKQPPQPLGTPSRPEESDAQNPIDTRAVISRRRSALVQSPMRTGALLCLHWRRVVVVAGGVVGLVAQMLLLSLAWELWDLSVSLMEVWAELARKHLEITLSR